MAVDLNAYTPARYPVDGAIANGSTPQTRLIQGAIARAYSAGGGIVELPAGVGTLMIDETINLMTGVDLWIPKGCQVTAPVGFLGPFFAGDTVTDVRIFGGGWIIGPYIYTFALNGIYLTNSEEVTIEGIRIAGMGLSGIVIDGDGYNVVKRAVIHDNGLHGIYFTNATARNKVTDCWTYSNGQAGGAAGDGVHLDGASVYTVISNLHAFDPAATFAAAQAYPVREAAASGCDFTLVVGLSASGNVTSDQPSFVGVNSKWLDSAATVALVGTPAAETSGATAVLGTSLNAAPLDHVHAMPTIPVKIGEVVCAGSQATVAFSSIPATYRHLLLEGSYALNAPHKLSLRVNGDTGANYSYSNCFIVNGSVNSGSSQTSLALDLGAVGALSGTVKASIPGYALTIINHDLHASWVAGLNIVETGGTWASTAAINALLLLLDAGNFVDGSVFTLYGIP